ncbi:MAG: hypothetical protein P8186_32715 [Anaerolineae bacterium]|jgi:nitric oxide reductase subunit B
MSTDSRGNGGLLTDRASSGGSQGSRLPPLVNVGFILTGSLFSNSLPSVRLGDPSLPYLLAGIGYPALVLVTGEFAVRFLGACEV